MHNDYLLSLILGIVEGLTEFLPVSSTAHLRITEALLHIDLGNGYWKMYSIVIQLGAILCLPIYFRKRIAKFIGTFPQGERGDRNLFTHPLSLTILAFVVTAVPAFLLTRIIGKHLEDLSIMGAALLIGGVIMWIVDAWFGENPTEVSRDLAPVMATASQPAAGGVPTAPNSTTIDYASPKTPWGFDRTNHMEEMSPTQAVWIGACQILSAVFPGTSRSMSTIAAGQLAGMSRASALEFSFFLSIPTMIVATGYDFLKTVILRKGEHHTTLPPVAMDTHGWIVLAIGFIVSFIVAFGVVAWFMAWVRRRGFAPFAIYRIIVGVLVLLWARHLIGT